MPIGLFSDTLLPQGDSVDTDVTSLCDMLRYPLENSDLQAILADALWQLQVSCQKLAYLLSTGWPTGDTFDVYGPDGELYAQLNQDGLVTLGLIADTVTTTDTTYAITQPNYTVRADTTSNDVTLTLPDAATAILGEIHVVKKVSAANNLILDGNGSDIDGAATQTLTANYASLTVQRFATGWDIIAKV